MHTCIGEIALHHFVRVLRMRDDLVALDYRPVIHKPICTGTNRADAAIIDRLAVGYNRMNVINHCDQGIANP